MTKYKKHIFVAAILLTIIVLPCIIFLPKIIRINRMREFINNKYNTNITDMPLEYGEENKEISRDILGHTLHRNIPYYAIFPFGDDEIYVIERDGVLSDSGQIREIGYMLGDYMTKITGYEITYVEITTVYAGGAYDTKIAQFIQEQFNELITDENIDIFFDRICDTEDTELRFYVPETENLTELCSGVTEKLSVFGEKETIKSMKLYVYSGDIEISKYDVRERAKDEYGNVDYSYWPSIFDYYYIKNIHADYLVDETTNNSFIMEGIMILGRRYDGIYNGYDINSWIFKEIHD